MPTPYTFVTGINAKVASGDDTNVWPVDRSVYAQLTLKLLLSLGLRFLADIDLILAVDEGNNGCQRISVVDVVSGASCVQGGLEAAWLSDCSVRSRRHVRQGQTRCGRYLWVCLVIPPLQ